MSDMLTITIPRPLAQKGDLVVIPRREYHMLLERKNMKQFAPSAAQKKALVRAEKNLAQNKTLSYHELASQLDIEN